MKYGILNIKWSQVHVFNSSTLEADLFELEASLVYILNSRTVENYIVKPYPKCWDMERCAITSVQAFFKKFF